MTSRTLPRPSRRLLLAVVVLLGALVVPTAAPTATAAGAAPLPPPFPGTVDEFYVVPDPLPAGERGDLIRVQPIDAGAGRTGWRVMYHSVDQAGHDRAVTGIVTVPDGPAPDGGWPVIAHAHGTTGIASQCAPSRGPALPVPVGIEGVAVQTDYIGLGPVGELHPYLQRAAEANAVLDSVRLAHRLDGVDVSDDWYLVGGSQGGHAALAANEDAVTQLPEHTLRATVALVPGGEVTRNFGDDIQVAILSALVLFGNQGEGDGIDLHDVFTPEAYAALEGPMLDGCAGDVIDAAIPLAAAGTMFAVDLDTVPAVRAWRERNEVARARGASPVMVVAGVQDIIVVIDRVRALRESLCAVGTPLTYLEVDGDHTTAGAIAAPQWTAWLQARAAGEPFTSDCSSPPATTPTVPVTAPAPSPTPTTPRAVPVTARARFTG